MIIIGALSGWQYPERRERCATTWFSDARRLGMMPVFLMGREGRETGIPAVLGGSGEMLFLDVPNGYPELPQRTRAFCRWALEGDDWTYLFKCDDDSYVSACRLAAYDTAGRDYIGAEWQPGVGYGSGGAGYFLSRKAAQIVAENLTEPTGAEDLLVGRLLARAGIPLSIEPRLIAFGDDAHRPRRDNDILTVHGVTAALFMAAHAEVGDAGL